MYGVYVSIPVSPSSAAIHASVHMVVCNMFATHGYKIRHAVVSGDPYETAMHTAMKSFLDGREDWWLSIDHDNPPTRNPLELLQARCDFIGFPTPVWRCDLPHPWAWNVYRKRRRGYEPMPRGQGLQEVDAVGSGCFLASRDIIESVRGQRPFLREYDADGLGGTCDTAFCERVRDKGYPVHVDWDRPCGHHKDVNLLELEPGYGNAETRTPRGR